MLSLMINEKAAQTWFNVPIVSHEWNFLMNTLVKPRVPDPAMLPRWGKKGRIYAK